MARDDVFDFCMAKIGDRDRVVAIEAYWDGDTAGWGIDLVCIHRRPSLNHPKFKEQRLCFFREPAGDMRLFNEAAPAWPEVEQARSLGTRLADELGVPLHGPPEGEPNDDHPRWWDLEGRAAVERPWEVAWRAVAMLENGGEDTHEGVLEVTTVAPRAALDHALRIAVEHERSREELRRHCTARTSVDGEELSWTVETVFRVPCPVEGVDLLRKAASGDRPWSEVLRELMQRHGVARDDLATVVLDNVDRRPKGEIWRLVHEWVHGVIDDSALDDGFPTG